MAVATTSITTSGTSVNKVWKKIQGSLAEGIQFESEEFDMVDDFAAPEDTPFSAREVTIPIDINEGAGVASIPEGGYEARESSPNVEEITVSMVQFNKRFNASRLAMYADKGEAQIKRQLLHQGAHAIRDLGRHFSDYFYGVSNGYLAQVNATTTATTGTYTLISGYGVSGVTDPAFLVDKFRAGDYVALVASSALVTNAIGLVGARSASAGTMVVTWNGSVVATSGDYIVKANSKGNTTIAHTDYSRGLTGMVDITTASSLHSLATSSVPNWDVAYSDTAAGRFSGTKVTRAEDEIANEGGGKVTTLLMDQAVRRDWINLERAALRFDSPMGMETDGSVKSKGRKILATRRVLPGFVYAFDKSALSKWTLLPKPDGKFSWGEGKEYIDENGMVFRIDMPVALICKNRKKFAYFSGQTRA